jgi:hypothetical protein
MEYWNDGRMVQRRRQETGDRIKSRRMAKTKIRQDLQD